MRSRTMLAFTLGALAMAGCGSSSSTPAPADKCPGCTTIYTSTTNKPYLVWLLKGMGTSTVAFAAHDATAMMPYSLYITSSTGSGTNNLVQFQNRANAVSGDSADLYWATSSQLLYTSWMGGVSTNLAPASMDPYSDVVADAGGNVAYGLASSGVFATRIGAMIATLSTSAGTAGLAVSPLDSALYWANVTGQLYRFAPGVMGGWSAGAAPVAYGSWSTARIAAGANGVYILDLTSGQLLKAPTTESMMPPPATVLDSCASPVGLAVSEPTAGTVGTIYYSCRGAAAGQGTVKKIKTDGTGKANVAVDRSSPAGVAVDGANVYWTDDVDGTVVKAPL